MRLINRPTRVLAQYQVFRPTQFGPQLWRIVSSEEQAAQLAADCGGSFELVYVPA